MEDLEALDLVPSYSRLRAEGVTWNRFFVNTPVCCPGRAQFLTGAAPASFASFVRPPGRSVGRVSSLGRFSHNTGFVANSIDTGCNSAGWIRDGESASLGTMAAAAGYATHYSGKYLNMYGNGKMGGAGHVPAGWGDWHALLGNSVFYDYSLSNNGVEEYHGTGADDYLTDVIGARFLSFLESEGGGPWFAILGTPSAHAPFEPTPGHYGRLANATRPKTPAYNASAADKHALVRRQGFLTEAAGAVPLPLSCLAAP